MKRILIIDDDIVLCEELAEMLKAEGFDVAFASDSQRGEAMTRCLDFDVLLLDSKMPAVTGMEILGRMKAESVKKKVIMITGNPTAAYDLEASGLQQIVRTVLPKPIDFPLLLQKINS